ncbi:hypothetical protein COB11_04290 [Candidatus Aerophobetes bacterium]|uniref:Uncharacterized protein n=1 Tax=Aerophobetes bacterium TaxID=2030807 RepID=A0A2A4YHF9_UNCAE|nr:MAG: hypothetical protein COB11_04290 [Candidatus Aerophobetes bacterium]
MATTVSLSSVQSGELFARLEDFEEYRSAEADKVADIAYRYFSSPLLWTFGAIGVALTVCPLSVSLSGITLTFSGLAVYPQNIHTSLLYEVVMVFNFMKAKFTDLGLMQSPYFNKLEDGIYLGALPLKSHLHHDLLIKDLKIHSVLSVLEDFEVTTKTFFTSPLTPKDWTKLGVNQLLISVVDMTPISNEDLHKAADFIHENKKGIYIHCKAGMGRSVMCYIAYLIKHKQVSFVEAFREARALRPTMNLKPLQFQALRGFENIIKYTDFSIN